MTGMMSEWKNEGVVVGRHMDRLYGWLYTCILADICNIIYIKLHTNSAINVLRINVLRKFRYLIDWSEIPFSYVFDPKINSLSY